MVFKTGSSTEDSLTASLDSGSDIKVGNFLLSPNKGVLVAAAFSAGSSVVWERLMLTYAAGSGASLVTHVASVDIMAAASTMSCDFVASAVIGPSAKGP